VPFWTSGHSTPHAPQLSGSVCVAMQTPLHLLKPALHEKPQLPLEHVATELGGVGQTLPHAPQWLGLVSVATH
jgi:hypothetical protein